MKGRTMRNALISTAAVVLLAVGATLPGVAAAQKAFATPEAAAEPEAAAGAAKASDIKAPAGEVRAAAAPDSDPAR